MRIGNALCLHCPHHSEQIPAIDLPDVVSRVAFFEQRPRQVGKLGDIFQALRRARDPVEIAADPHSVNSSNLDDVIDMRHHVGQGRGRHALLILRQCRGVFLHFRASCVARNALLASSAFCDKNSQ